MPHRQTTSHRIKAKVCKGNNPSYYSFFSPLELDVKPPRHRNYSKMNDERERNAIILVLLLSGKKQKNKLTNAARGNLQPNWVTWLVVLSWNRHANRIECHRWHHLINCRWQTDGVALSVAFETFKWGLRERARVVPNARYMRWTVEYSLLHRFLSLLVDANTDRFSGRFSFLYLGIIEVVGRCC